MAFYFTFGRRWMAAALLFFCLAATLHAQTAPLITSPSLATGGIGLSFSYALTGANSPTSFTATGVPTGLSFNSATAVISGTPATTGTFSLSLSAINASGTATQPLEIVIFPPATQATGRIGLGFYYAITGTNNPTSFSATGVPAGLSLNNSTGVISGTPTATGTFPLSLGAINASGTSTRPFTIVVYPPPPDMAKGADVGWLQQMAVSNFQFYDTNAQQLDPDPVTNCLKILKERNIDTIRLRIFVPPIVASNWDNQLSGNCTIDEMLPLAQKATALGMRVLISLHYSWTFADPGNQRIPVQWVSDIAGMSSTQAVAKLTADLSAYTTYVVQELQAGGVTPEWISLGNEITNGMLLHVENNPGIVARTSPNYGTGANLAAFINAGYNAVKAVNPTIKTVIHIDRAHDDSLDKGFFTTLKGNGGHWDVSATDVSGGTYSDIQQTVNDLAASFTAPGQGGAGVMMLEMEPPDIYSGSTYNPLPNFDFVNYILNIMRGVPGGKGLGSIYWEPEADPLWRGYLQSAWTNHQPSSALDVFRPAILQASGTAIVNGTSGGQTVLLQGVNLGGWMVMEPWMTPADASGLPDEYSIISELDSRFGIATEQSLVQTYRQNWINSADLDNIKAQGLNVVRVPVWWGDFYPLSARGTTNPAMRSDAFTMLDWLAAAAAERGIRIIIDMHGVFGGQSTSADTGCQNLNQYWTNTNDQINTQLMWTAIAAHYAGNPWIAGYDLLNEPSGAPSNQAVITQLSNLYTAVRAVDPSHIIFMEGTWGNWNWDMLPNPTSAGWTNVVYEMHEYQWSNETISGVEAGADNQVIDYNNHLSYNVPAYIGEFNAFGTGTPAWQYVINDFSNAGMNWSAWSYKATHGTGMDSWGLYDPTGKATVPNIVTTSSSTIASDWAGWTTSNAFAINPMLPTAVTTSPSITSLTQSVAESLAPFSYNITATNGPTGFNATGLPPGLTINTATGVISGTASVVNASNSVEYNVALTATTSIGVCTGNLLLTVTPPGPVITSSLTATATAGVLFNDYLHGTNGMNGLSATGLPPGLSIVSDNQLITGTATAIGTWSVQLTGNNSWGPGPVATMTLTVNAPPAPVISSGTTASGTVGTAFSYTIAASNNPASYSATGLPAGLSLNSGSGVISGTVAAAGIFNIGLGAINLGGTGSKTLKLTIPYTTPPVITVPSTVVAQATGGAGAVVNFTTTAVDEDGGTCVTTNVPASGSLFADGTNTVTVTAKDIDNNQSTASFNVVVVPAVQTPLPPSGLTATAWDGQIDLCWNPSTFATSYIVLSSTSANGPYSVAGSNVTIPYFSGTGLSDGVAYFYKVDAVGASGTSADTATVSATPVLGAGYKAWSSEDIGSVNLSGSATYLSGTYTVVGAGADIYGSADAFHFLSQPMTGDGAIIARVVSIQGGSPWAKVGVMFRETLATNATNMFSVVTASSGAGAQWRPSTGSNTTWEGVTGPVAPFWVKLVRSGSTFTAYNSPDGVIWIQQGPSQVFTMASNAYVGLAVTDHNSAARCTAVIDSVSVLPSQTWSAADIGSPSVAGFTRTSSAVTTIEASGTDIGGAADQCRYVYQPADGNSSITAQVTGVENTNAFAKAGIMIRETLAANSDNVALFSSAQNGILFQQRAVTGGTSLQSAQNSALNAPYWLRLTRSGSTFTAYTAPDGATWTALSSTTVSMATKAYIGIAASSDNPMVLGAARVQNITVSTSNPSAPVISSATVTSGSENSAYSYTIVASDSPSSYYADGLPAGLTINTATGVISGTPTVSGTFGINLTANNEGGSAVTVMNLTVNPPPPVISSALTATAATGTAFTYTITASNSPTSFSATGLPSGLAFNATTGVVSGTAIATGTSTVTLSAGNAGGTGTATLKLTVNLGAPIISSAAAATAIMGTGFTYTITANNSPTSFSETGLPSGLTLNTTTGVISGTATATGTSTVTLGAGNAAGTKTATLTLTVNPPPPVIISASTATGIIGTAFSYTINASNSPTNFGAAGLPSGLSLNGTNGVISGIATTIGTSRVILRANNVTATGTAPLMLTMNMPAPAITSTLTATATNGAAFSYQITASNSPTSYSAMGLPAGLSVNGTTGLISGTTTATGTNDVTISAINLGGTGSAVLALVVGPPYAAWRGGMFTQAQLANGSISGDYADPAGDGIPNLLKYALGINPWTNGVSGLPVETLAITGSGNYPTLIYTRPLSASDITYTVQVSTGLNTWNSGPGYTMTTGTTDNQDETESVTVQSVLPVSGTNPNLFMRLQVTGP